MIPVGICQLCGRNFLTMPQNGIDAYAHQRHPGRGYPPCGGLVRRLTAEELDLHRFVERMEAFRRDTTSTPEKARAVLRRSGFLDENDEIAAPYKGSPNQDADRNGE